MALKIVEGVVLELGPATTIAPAEGATAAAGTSWTFVQFALAQREPVTVANVMADAGVGAVLAPGKAGRFAFYEFGRKRVLCGFADDDAMRIVSTEQDPAIAATDVVRLPARRKIFWGVVLIPTIIGLFFAFDMIKAGRKVLLENPKPKRPPDKRIAAALQGKWYWPF